MGTAVVHNNLNYIQLCIHLLLVAAQAQFIGCYTDPGCDTLVAGGPSSNAEECCVVNDAGMYYNDGGQCFQCVGKC